MSQDDGLRKGGWFDCSVRGVGWVVVDHPKRSFVVFFFFFSVNVRTFGSGRVGPGSIPCVMITDDVTFGWDYVLLVSDPKIFRYGAKVMAIQDIVLFFPS